MVNEMIKEFAKSSDRDIKQKISDGINEMDVLKPKDIINREWKNLDTLQLKTSFMDNLNKSFKSINKTARTL